MDSSTLKSILTKQVANSSTDTTHGPMLNYITEKLYMLLQLYCQNKNWSPSLEVLQCFTDLKELPILQNPSFFQVVANRITLDAQGRLILRENGKIILPYEHFANAVMLKHMSGPHGMHLGIEGTIRAVTESYTMGRENFGMDTDFIIEVIHNCKNAACRYYKDQIDASENLHKVNHSSNSIQFNQSDNRHKLPHGLNSDNKKASSVGKTGQQQIGSNFLQQSRHNESKSRNQYHNYGHEKNRVQKSSLVNNEQQQQQHVIEHMLSDFIRSNLDGFENMSSSQNQPFNAKDILSSLHANNTWSSMSSLSNAAPSVSITMSTVSPASTSTSILNSISNFNLNHDDKQEKIIRAFSDIVKNIHKIKTCVRPSMCKPYGKQSESLQKTLIDTVQLIQSLRNFLPPPHIHVNSWKTDDKHRYDE